MNKHTILPLAVVALSLLFINPGMVFGHHSFTTMFLAAGLLLLVSIYGYYVLVDRADDEREVMVRSFADRLASLGGMATLLAIIGWCSLTGHPVPTTTIIVLVVMVSAKAFGQWYACKYY
jgi:hypothetical protein